MKIRRWEDLDSLEEELAIKESRMKTNKKKKKGYNKNEEYSPSGKKKFTYRKNDKGPSNHPNRI